MPLFGTNEPGKTQYSELWWLGIDIIPSKQRGNNMDAST